jgi:homoserine kinase
MEVKTNFFKKDFIQILSNYDLGEFVNYKPFTTGNVQSNFLIQTTEGKFVFRYYENRSTNSVLFEGNLIKYLKDKNFPCPAPFKNKQGELVGTYKEKPFVIFEFIEGVHIKNPNENQKRELVKRVAELQNITKSYRPQNKKYRWNYSIELCRELARKKVQKLKAKDAKGKLKWLESELTKLNLPKSLPKGICHCDFHFSNILFKNGRFNALLDFDDANYTYKIYDLACLIDPFKFSWNNWNKYKMSDQVFNFKESRKMLNEYMKYRPLTNVEKHHLFDVYKLSILIDCIWYFHRRGPEDFYERRKITSLNNLGREKFYKKIFT